MTKTFFLIFWKFLFLKIGNIVIYNYFQLHDNHVLTFLSLLSNVIVEKIQLDFELLILIFWQFIDISWILNNLIFNDNWEVQRPETGSLMQSNLKNPLEKNKTLFKNVEAGIISFYDVRYRNSFFFPFHFLHSYNLTSSFDLLVNITVSVVYHHLINF